MPEVLHRDDINRALLLQGFCPSEHHCTNQMFSKRQYVKLETVSAWGDIPALLHCINTWQPLNRVVAHAYW